MIQRETITWLPYPEYTPPQFGYYLVSKGSRYRTFSAFWHAESSPETPWRDEAGREIKGILAWGNMPNGWVVK